MKSEFYVGYFDKAPKGVARFIRASMGFVFLAVIGIAWLIAGQQRGFIASTYEYDQEVVLSGLLISDPVPAIQVYLGRTNDQTPLMQTILVVQFGKKGGEALLKDLNNRWVSAKGHLIYFDGKTLIEITDPINIVTSDLPPPDLPALETPKTKYQGTVSLKGEIVDAKCFFGVMKPGHGKPHRSCAIRCISGGIPAVLRTKDKSGNPAYHLIIWESGSRKQLADYVGESVEVEGVEGEFYDWKVLKISDISSVVSLSSMEEPVLSRTLTLCFN